MQLSERRFRPAPQRSSNPPVRIAVVDDEDAMRRLLRNAFENVGFIVNEARGEAELMAIMKAHDIALVTLDLSLRGEDGLCLARTIQSTSDVPIIMVTARTDDVDRIVGLELGADDYIAKPFNVRELVARVRAVLRRTRDRADRFSLDQRARLQFDGWTIDFDAREVTSPKMQLVDLTSGEFKLLETLIRHPGRVLSRDFLIDAIGGINAAPLERSIDTIVSRLRRKIEINSAHPQIIKTVRSGGYIFAAKVLG